MVFFRLYVYQKRQESSDDFMHSFQSKGSGCFEMDCCSSNNSFTHLFFLSQLQQQCYWKRNEYNLEKQIQGTSRRRVKRSFIEEEGLFLSKKACQGRADENHKNCNQKKICKDLCVCFKSWGSWSTEEGVEKAEKQRKKHFSYQTCAATLQYC